MDNSANSLKSQANGLYAPGTVIDERFVILEFCGQGSTGQVYKARNVLSGELVAIKIFAPLMTRDEHSLDRFFREAKLASQLNHQNIVAIKAFGKSANATIYMVQEYLEGQTLEQLIQLNKFLVLKDIHPIALCVADALHYAHCLGVVHRDIKPANIMVMNFGSEECSAKILDFGLAALLDTTADGSQQLTKTGVISGTPAYLSPERCRGEKATPPADIYALGCVLYETLLGKAPFVGETILETMSMHLNNEPVFPTSPALNPDLKQIIKRCLCKQTTGRYASTKELYEALASIEISRRQHAWPLRKTVTATVILSLALVSIVVLAMVSHNKSLPAQTKQTSSNWEGSNKIAILKLQLESARKKEDRGAMRKILEELVSYISPQLPKGKTLLRGQNARAAITLMQAHKDLAFQTADSVEERTQHLNAALDIADNYLGSEGSEAANTYNLAACFAAPEQKAKLFDKAVAAETEKQKLTLITEAGMQCVHDARVQDAIYFESRASQKLPRSSTDMERLRVYTLRAAIAALQNDYPSYRQWFVSSKKLIDGHNIFSRQAAELCQTIAESFKYSHPQIAQEWNDEAMELTQEGGPSSVGLEGQLLVQRSRILLGLKKYNEVIKNAVAGLKVAGISKSLKATFLLDQGIAYCELKEYQKAIEKLQEARKVAIDCDYGTKFGILQNLLKCQDLARDYQGAKQTAVQIIEASKADPVAYKTSVAHAQQILSRH